MNSKRDRDDIRNQALNALFQDFVLAHRGKSVAMVALMLLGGLFEGLGFAATLPIIASIDQENIAGQKSSITRFFQHLLHLFGFESTLGSLLMLVAIMITLKAIALVWANKQVGYTIAHVIADLRKKFLSGVLHANWQFMSGQEAGKIVNSLATEAERSGRAYESLCLVVSLVFQLMVYTILAFLISWKLAISSLVAGAVILFLLKPFVSMSRDIGRRQTDITKEMMVRIVDGIRGLKSLKAMSREEGLSNHLNEQVEGLNNTTRDAVLMRNIVQNGTEPVIVVFILVGIYLSQKYLSMPLSSMMIMAMVFYRLLTRIGNIQGNWQRVMMAESAYLVMKKTLSQMVQNQENTHGGVKPKLPAPITLKNVIFSYHEKIILKNINLEIGVGEITVVIGPSGSGKTTLADLIIGLLLPNSGQIMIGDQDLKDIDLKEWRNNIGYVAQELFLFNTPLIENIRLDDQSISEERIEAALRAAGAWDFVSALPNGMHTSVGEGGAWLSGGQRQRISIARALVRDPALLIFDEATSALDPETEKEICQTIKALAAQRNVLAITHQASWVKISDKVVRLDSGSMLNSSQINSEVI